MLSGENQTARLFFQSTFQNMQTPVVVCEKSSRHPIVFANASAWLIMNPQSVTEGLHRNNKTYFLGDVLMFKSEAVRAGLFITLGMVGSVTDYKADICTYDGKEISMTISANIAEAMGTQYILLYLHQADTSTLSAMDVQQMLRTLFHISNQEATADGAIRGMLSYTGDRLGVSRAYIFESISAELTRNTYEWCGPGIAPAIDDLQSLRKADYNYDVIMGSGMYVTDDVRMLPDNDRAILEAQGIRAIAILPLFHADAPLGYIGFDDCAQNRKWSPLEIDMLRSLASLIASLIVRRDSEQKMTRSREILQTISDNLENIIYVNDPDTYEIVFINKALSDSINRSADSIVGGICWKLLQRDMTGPCPFCPLPRMKAEGLMESGKSYAWEFQNTMNGKWYLIKDAFIKWIDGRLVHIETAIEITHQKEYEEQLHYYASTDVMTGAFNREWGYKVMRDMAAPGGLGGSLVFIDIDELKSVNDRYGHEEGDNLIRQTVRIIRSSIRKSDVMCRWGGDEFILLLQCPPDVAQRIMLTISEKIAAYNRTGEVPYPLGICYGINALPPDSAASIDTFISEADHRMYLQKETKRQAAER